MRADEYPCESASSRVRIRLGNHPYRPYFYFMEYGMVAKWAFLCPKSKNEHNLKPLGKIFEDPLCPTFLGIIGHNLEIEGILRKFHYAPHFLAIMRHNFNSLYNFHVNFHFSTEKLFISLLLSNFFFKIFLHLKRSPYGKKFLGIIFFGKKISKSLRPGENLLKKCKKKYRYGGLFWQGHNLTYFEALWGIFSL